MSSSQQHMAIDESTLMAYINGELPATQIESVQIWLKASEKHRQEFEQLKKTWEASGKLFPKPVAVNTDLAWESVKAKINQVEKPLQHKKTNSIVPLFISIAAILTLAFFTFQFWNGSNQNIELATTNQTIEKALNDGSVITMNRDSKITYASNFGEKERKISLTGEAFFDVARDTTTPFIIELPENNFVKVLGTSFSISTNGVDNTTIVFVKSGIVEFGNTNESLILTANEKAIYRSKTQSFKKLENALTADEELYWINEQLIFEGESLKDITVKLEHIFNTRILLKCESAGDLPIISNHQHEQLDDILMVICLVHNLNLNKESEGGKDIYTITCNE